MRPLKVRVGLGRNGMCDHEACRGTRQLLGPSNPGVCAGGARGAPGARAVGPRSRGGGGGGGRARHRPVESLVPLGGEDGDDVGPRRLVRDAVVAARALDERARHLDKAPESYGW